METKMRGVAAWAERVITCEDDELEDGGEASAAVEEIKTVVLREKIGYGASATVFRGSCDALDDDVAVKVFYAETHTPHRGTVDMRARGVQEMRLMMKAGEHRHICKLLGKAGGKGKFCLILEHAVGGDLVTAINAHGPLGEARSRRLFRQIASAVQHLHGRKIVHRDLKPENVLLDERGDALLCDFGLAAAWCPGRRLTGWVGTINYVAPEVAAHRPYSGPEADIWSLGTILLAMLTARMPFGPPEEDETRRNIERANYEVPRGASAAVLDLLARLLQPDPLRRATMADVLHHPWLRARDLEGEWGAEAPVCPPPPLAHGEAEGADRAGVGSYSSDDDPIPYSQLFPL